ncbi:MAG TPA: hypothetical protein VGI16_12355 [Candidatus Acidoferrum sp.]
MLTAYIDESSHEAGTVVLAGFIGTKEQWESFIPLWKNALGQRKRLHTRRLRWKQPATKSLLERLAPIPFKCGLRPVYASVTDSDFSDLLETDLEKWIHKTYILAVLPMLLLIINNIPENETIRFVFDQQLQYENFVRLIFLYLERYKTADGRSKLADVEFVYRSPLTEPGDYLAFAITQIRRDSHSQKADWCAPIVLHLVMPNVDPIVCQPTRDDVRYVVEAGKRISNKKNEDKDEGNSGRT